MLYGWKEWQDDHHDIFGARPCGSQWDVAGVDRAIAGNRRDFFRQNFL